MNESIVQNIISVIGGVLIAYFTYAYRANTNTKKAAEKPSRMENVFDGYEGLITQLKEEIDRKGKIIFEMEIQIKNQQTMIDTMKGELENTKEHSERIQQQLHTLKRDYENRKQ